MQVQIFLLQVMQTLPCLQELLLFQLVNIQIPAQFDNSQLECSIIQKNSGYK
jgi:hypothetical protein